MFWSLLFCLSVLQWRSRGLALCFDAENGLRATGLLLPSDSSWSCFSSLSSSIPLLTPSPPLTDLNPSHTYPIWSNWSCRVKLKREEHVLLFTNFSTSSNFFILKFWNFGRFSWKFYGISQFAWMEACLGTIFVMARDLDPKVGFFIWRYSYFVDLKLKFDDFLLGTLEYVWVKCIKGGGWCNTIASCSSRAMTSLGSSNYFEDEVPFEGVLSSEPSQNPGTRNLHCCRFL